MTKWGELENIWKMPTAGQRMISNIKLKEKLTGEKIISFVFIDNEKNKVMNDR